MEGLRTTDYAGYLADTIRHTANAGEFCIAVIDDNLTPEERACLTDGSWLAPLLTDVSWYYPMVAELAGPDPLLALSAEERRVILDFPTRKSFFQLWCAHLATACGKHDKRLHAVLQICALTLAEERRLTSMDPDTALERLRLRPDEFELDPSRICPVNWPDVIPGGCMECHE